MRLKNKLCKRWKNTDSENDAGMKKHKVLLKKILTEAEQQY
jgi:hypothetical protein